MRLLKEHQYSGDTYEIDISDPDAVLQAFQQIEAIMLDHPKEAILMHSGHHTRKEVHEALRLLKRGILKHCSVDYTSGFP